MTERKGKRGGHPLHVRIFAGLALGAGFGVMAHIAAGPGGGLEWFVSNVTEPVGQIWLRSLIMIVIPLVFCSLALGVAGLGNLKALGRIGLRTILTFLWLTTASVTIGLFLVNAVRPGARLPRETQIRLMEVYGTAAAESGQQARAASQEFGVQTIVQIVPRNPLDAMARGDMLAVIFTALMAGVALTLIRPERASPVLRVLEGVGDATVAVIDLVMKVAPYGVFALIFSVTARFGYSLLLSLGWYVGTVLAGLLIHLVVTYSITVRALAGLNPWTFFRKIRVIMLTAFSTSSSNGTLPTTMRVSEEELGIPREIGGFVLPLGSTMNMNGTALFEGVTVLFLAQVFGMDLDLPTQIIVIIMSVLTAVGAAGVPSGSIPLLMIVLQMVHVPAEGIALILGVDRILDMCRTVLNVSGDVTTAAIVARAEGKLGAAARI